MMKNRLSIFQIICIIAASIPPFIDGIVKWIVWVYFPVAENISTKDMSMNNLMNTQIEGFASVLFWMFYISIVLTAIYCVLDIFEIIKNNFVKLSNNKAIIALPSVTLLLYVVMMIIADNHSSTFTYYGQTRYTGVSLGVLAYIELIPLIAVVLVEIYKQTKLVDIGNP